MHRGIPEFRLVDSIHRTRIKGRLSRTSIGGEIPTGAANFTFIGRRIRGRKRAFIWLRVFPPEPHENFASRVAEKERTARDKCARGRRIPGTDEPQLEKPVATDSVALTDNNFVCVLSSFRRRQAIQLPIYRAWWISFIQPSLGVTVSSSPQVSLSVLLFFFSRWKIFSHGSEIFPSLLFANGTRNFELIATSWLL